MDLTSESIIKSLLKKYRLRPSKKFGQNFLIDKGAVKKIVEAADLNPEDVVLEIGPGIGVLTQELAKGVKKVIAVEKDRRMCEILKELLDCWKVRNVKIIQGDILKLRGPSSLMRTGLVYKVIGNLPFYLTAPVIRKFLENTGVQPLQMVLVVQKEVGQRICAKPPRMNLLAVSVQIYATPEIISYVSKSSFWPEPKVDAALIKITPGPTPVGEGQRELFFRIVKAGFSQPRKQIVNNFSKMLKLDRERIKSWLLKNNIQPSQRAETLIIKDWKNLTNTSKIVLQ